MLINEFCFSIRSVKLAQNIIEAVRKLKPTVYQKSLLYMVIGEILTNSDTTDNVEFLKKFVKSVDVLVNCLSKVRISFQSWILFQPS